uniref:Uncharacterized protein n=1 Tax=Leersia perrieri TaxID=77586 RepID=A0A0D9XXS3_9ORYZ
MAAVAGTLAPAVLPLPRPHPITQIPTPHAFLRPRRLRLAAVVVTRATNGNGNGNGNGGDGDGDGGGPPADVAGEEEMRTRKGPSLPALSEIRWGELLTPEPANAAAVALTAALAWAGASLLLQLALISFAIFAAAVKYSFVAALLLFVLIALL